MAAPLDDATVAEAKRLRGLTGSTGVNVYAVILLILACWRGGVFDLCAAAARNFGDANERNAMHRQENLDFLATKGVVWDEGAMVFHEKVP